MDFKLGVVPLQMWTPDIYGGTVAQFVTQWHQPAHPASPIFFGKAVIVVTLVHPHSTQIVHWKHEPNKINGVSHGIN